MGPCRNSKRKSVSCSTACCNSHTYDFSHFPVFGRGIAHREVLACHLDEYLWHRDRFTLELSLGEQDEEPHLAGHMRTGAVVQ
eukprot:4542034-Amphidinium_carterae.1